MRRGELRRRDTAIETREITSEGSRIGQRVKVRERVALSEVCMRKSVHQLILFEMRRGISLRFHALVAVLGAKGARSRRCAACSGGSTSPFSSSGAYVMSLRRAMPRSAYS